MIRINLLPFRAARTKENVRRQISIFLLMIALLFVGMFGYKLHLNSKEKDEQERLQAINIELERYTIQAKEVDAILKENETLQKKIDIINDLEEVRKEPVTLLTLLTDVVVEERMWLTNFDVKDKSVVVKGLSIDEITVADFDKRLQASPLFSDVVLKFLKQNETASIKLKAFEISGTIAQMDKKNTDTSKALK